MRHGLSRHRGRALKRRDDVLCEQLLGVLCHLADALEGGVECQACGQLADPERPCPVCAERRRQARP
jgi:recombinational DNA repair protein RecR